MEKSTAIEKVKLLLRLAASAPENEAANAQEMASKFIDKFGLKPEDYEEKEEVPIYTDDELLFESLDFQEWRSILALAVGNKYDCLIIQETNTASTGEVVYKYFVYGDPVDVITVKQLYAFVTVEIQKLLDMNCRGRGDLYRTSYAEGVVNGVRINIEFEDFETEAIVIQKGDKVESSIKENKAALATIEDSKEKDIPIKDKVKVNNGEKPLDIIAYFRGEGDGRTIHIGKLNSKKVLPVEVEDYSYLSELANLLKE